MTIAQHYNQARRRMEVPIIDVGGETATLNRISFCSLVNTDLSTFDSIAMDWDRVRRMTSGAIYTAYTYGGVWYGSVADVEPIEAGVGYEYERALNAGSTTWYYDCVLFPSATRSQLCRPIGTKGVLRQ